MIWFFCLEGVGRYIIFDMYLEIVDGVDEFGEIVDVYDVVVEWVFLDL